MRGRSSVASSRGRASPAAGTDIRQRYSRPGAPRDCSDVVPVYRRFDAGVFFPSVGGSRNHADVWVSYLQRDTDFFGIGPQTSLDLESQFVSRRRSVQGSFYRDVTDHVQGGVYAQVMATQTSLALDAAAVSIDERFSSTPVPPLDRWIPGLGLNTDVLVYGGFVVDDTRDDSLGLTRGVDFYGRVALADGVGRHDPLASYGWIEGEVDLRGYAPLGSPRTSLLLRARGLFKSPRARGVRFPSTTSPGWEGGRRFAATIPTAFAATT